MIALTLLLVSVVFHQSFCDNTTPDPWASLSCCDFLAPKCPTDFGCEENPNTWECRCVMPPDIQLQRMQQAELVRAGHQDDHTHDNEDETISGPIVNLNGR